LTETATVVRYAAGVDEYGNVSRGAATRTDYPARLEQLAADEIVRDRDTILADWRVFLPATADVSPYDRLEARGHVFEIQGLPNQLRTPVGAHHIEAQLKYQA
jgi:hypothetical protein